MSEANQQPPPQPPPAYPPYPYYPQEEDELSLIDLWSIVWRRKWLWLTLGPLFCIVGIVYALMQTEIFRAEVTLAPAQEERGGGGLSALAGQFGGLASLAGVNLGGAGSVETALAVLNSRQFLIPFLTQGDRLEAIFPDQWDEEAQAWTVTNEHRGPDGKPTELEAYRRFTQEYLKISNDAKTGIVELAVELPDPQLAAEWANELARRLNSYLRQQASAEAEKNLEFLNQQLQETQMIEIREALYGLIEQETKTAMLANAKEEFAFRIIDPAIPPEERARPKRALIVVASGMLGGFLGIFLCFVLHFVEQAKKRPQP